MRRSAEPVKMSVEELHSTLVSRFPLNATCWSEATDEIRDMSRGSRKIRSLSEEHAVDFCEISTPSEWNTKGIHSIIVNYSHMDDGQRQEFIQEFKSFLKC